MNHIKIIFFDVDGTLIDMKAKEISKKTIQMLDSLKSKGIKICLATGRCPFELSSFKNIAFDAYLTCNGSLCYDQTEIFYNMPIPREDVQTLIRNAAKLSRPVCVATKNGLAANGLDKDLSDYYSFAYQKLSVATDFEAICKEEIYKLSLGCRESDYSAILDNTTGSKTAAWWDRAVDIIPAKGGKGQGIQRTLHYFHLDKSEAMAFGDGNNDIEMLQAVGTSIAMENASPKLKSIADDVCGHVAQDGIYHYLIKKGFI